MADIVCEILDHNSWKVIEHNEALRYRFEWCVSNEIIAKSLAMVGESRFFSQVLESLLDYKGQQFCVREVSKFVRPGESYNWYHIMQCAQLQREIAIGYFRYNVMYPDKKEAILNPHDKHEIITWQPEDCIITIALNEMENYSKSYNKIPLREVKGLSLVSVKPEPQSWSSDLDATRECRDIL